MKARRAGEILHGHVHINRGDCSGARAIPAPLFNACFVLFVINASFFPAAFFAHWWIFDDRGLGIPTDSGRGARPEL